MKFDNVHEFIAEIFSNPQFLNSLNNYQDKSNNLSWIKRTIKQLGDFVMRVLDNLGLVNYKKPKKFNQTELSDLSRMVN